MSDLLGDALRLTVLGMGMTFLSIGALVGGMFLLTWVTRARSGPGPSERLRPGAGSDSRAGQLDVGSPDAAPSCSGPDLAESPPGLSESAWEHEEGRRRAVAAAVAVSLALDAASGRALTRSLPEPSPGAGVREESLWNAYARGLHLSARSAWDHRRIEGGSSNASLSRHR
jgi:hypothetical protein